MKFFSALILLVFHINVSISSGQTPDIETLEEAARKTKGKEKAQILSDLSFRYCNINPVQGVRYGSEALKLANFMRFEALRPGIYNNLGANYLMLSRFDSARYCFSKALIFGNQHKDSMSIATALARMGVMYEKLGLFDSAIVVFDKSLAIYTLLRNAERMGVVNENLGMIHLHKGELKTALIFLLEAEKHFLAADLRNRLPSLYLKIGRVYSETRDFDAAQRFYRKGRLKAKEAGDFNSEAIAVNAIGILYKNQGKNNEAIETFREVLPMAEKMKNMALILAVYANMANVYQVQKDFRQALDYQQKAMAVAEGIGNPVIIAQRNVGIGDALSGTGNYEEALLHYRKALPVLEASGARTDLMVTYRNMIEAGKNAGDYTTALDLWEKYTALKDSLNRNELNMALDSLKVKFDTEHALRDNALLTQSNDLQSKIIRQQKIIMYVAFAFALLMMGFIFFVAKSRLRLKKAGELLSLKNEKISVKAIELADKNEQLVELTRFKDSMNSFLVHDLKNPLNSIISYKPDDADPVLAETIRQTGLQMLQIVTNILDVSRFENARLAFDCEIVRLTELFQLAYQETAYLANQKSIKISRHFGGDYLLNIDTQIIKRVMVNLLTNAIKFSQNGVTVRMIAEAYGEQQIKITVVNEGEGLDPGFLPFVFEKYTQGMRRNSGFAASTGIGLAFCRMAVEAHGGQIGVVSEQGKGASFWFTVPAKLDETHDIEEIQTVDDDKFFSINLEISDRQYLAPFCDALKQISVHQYSEVKAIATRIEGKTPGIVSWKTLLLQALAHCDEAMYNRLIQHDNEYPV